MQKVFSPLLILCLLFSCHTVENKNQTVNNESQTNSTANKKTSLNKNREELAFANVPLTDREIADTKKNSSSASDQPAKAYKKSSDTLRQSLKQIYKNDFLIGTAINTTDLSNSSLVNLIKNQFSSLSPKKAFQPMTVHPSENVYKWDDADMIMNFAQQNNIKLRGHCLVYDLHMPKWFYKDGNHQASKELILQRIKDHVTAEVSRYKGKVYCWDVVNEAMRKNDSLYAICGEDYITKAFEYAHEADPSVKLYYNDGIYDASQRDKFYKLIKKWKSQGVPIDGIGIQYHLGIEGKSADEIQKDIDAFSSLGLEVQITELDVSIYPRMSTPESVANVSDSLTTNVADQQAAVYKTIFDVCKRNKNKVKAVTIWGVGDGDSFLVQKLNKKNYPYLFSNNLQPKKAFDAIINAQ